MNQDFGSGKTSGQDALAQSAKSITLVTDSNLEAVFLVGLAIRAFCSFIRLSEVAAYEVELTVVEAVNNIIKHAYGNEKGHAVEILVSLHVDRLAFQICDSGRTLDPNQVSALNFDPDDLDALPEGGMGVHIMQSVMDRVEYSRSEGRNILSLVKFFEKKA